jgi:ATP-dependent Clp protease adapter protein ClpS
MFSKLTILLALLFSLIASDAFVIRPSPAQHRLVRLYAEGEKEGGAAIAKPKIKTDIKTKEKVKQKEKIKRKARIDEPKSRRKEEFQDAPLFKVMLLGDDSYDIGHVVDRLCAIIEDLDEGAASTIFQQAQQEGKAMCGKYPMEHAEMYKEQLIRSDPMIFSDIEEENK